MTHSFPTRRSSDLPTAPEPLGNLDAIHRPGITFVASQMLLLAEVLRILGIGSSDDVPAGPAVAQMVQRGELAGKQERPLIGRVRGGNEADLPGVLSQRGQEGAGLEARRARRGGAGRENL